MRKYLKWTGNVTATAVVAVVLLVGSLYLGRAANNASVCVFDFSTADPCTGVAAGVSLVNPKGTRYANVATFRTVVGPVTSFVTTPTDFFVMTGSASKLVRVTNLTICGTATSAATIDVILAKHTTANTGGTTTSANVNPLQGETATATAVTYQSGSNPTVGTAITIDTFKLNLGAAGSAGCASVDFGTRNTEAAVLNGTTQQFAVNFNGQTIPAGTSIDLRAEDTEE